MVLLAVTAETWIVTGLGFGIVLVLLICLVFILQFFGWVMQKAEEPKKPKVEKAAPQAPVASAEPTDEGTKAAIAMSLAQVGDEDIAAVAYALYLSRDVKHDIVSSHITLTKRETAWNTKSIGMNNQGF